MKTGSKTIKYIAIKNHILQMIQDGKYKIGDKLPSENEIAKEHDVSVITSKKALDELQNDGYIYRIKGSGSFVAEIEKTDNTKDVRMIAMVLPLGNETGGGMELFYGVEMIAKKHGYYVSLKNTHYDCQTEREIILGLLKDNIDGIIYYPSYSSENFDLIKKLSMEKYPIVVIDKTIYDIDIDTVLCDNYAGSYKMTKYLLEMGHKNIAFVCEDGIDKTSSVRERFLGYCAAISEADISLDVNLVLCSKAACGQEPKKSNRVLFGEEIVEELEKNKNITAVQAASDADAVELIQQCKKKNIAVPDEVTIVGFDDLDVASYITPQLTTVKQDFKDIGKNAAELLFKRIYDNGRKTEKIILPASLIVRESSQNTEKSTRNTEAI